MKSLAREAALSVVYLGEIEHGKKYPSALILERIAQALGLAVPDLLEMVAAELRVVAQPVTTHAVGSRLPISSDASSRAIIQGTRTVELRAAA